MCDECREETQTLVIPFLCPLLTLSASVYVYLHTSIYVIILYDYLGNTHDFFLFKLLRFYRYSFPSFCFNLKYHTFPWSSSTVHVFEGSRRSKHMRTWIRSYQLTYKVYKFWNSVILVYCIVLKNFTTVDIQEIKDM